MIAAARTTHANSAEHRRQLAEIINQLILGRGNNTGTLTIEAGTTSTVVSNVIAHMGSVPLLMPTNAEAALLRPWLSGATKGAFTLQHDAPAADATFAYTLTG